MRGRLGRWLPRARDAGLCSAGGGCRRGCGEAADLLSARVSWCGAAGEDGDRAGGEARDEGEGGDGGTNNAMGGTTAGRKSQLSHEADGWMCV